MLPLLGALLSVLAAGAQETHAAETGWSFGVGYTPEYFHWHETSNYVWWTSQGDELTGDAYRFVTEEGLRHRLHVDLEYRPDPKIRLAARATYIYGTVDYDGGTQPASRSSAITWPRDSEEIDGQTYYKFAKKPLESTTGFEGWQFDAAAHGEIPLQARLFMDASLGWSYRSTKRMLGYDGTGSSGSGYDETWQLSWTEVGVGPGIRTRNWTATLRGVCLVPLNSSNDVDMSGVSFTLAPRANVGWRGELGVEWTSGLRIAASYEARDFSVSPEVALAVSGQTYTFTQPASVERVGRVDVSWFF